MTDHDPLCPQPAYDRPCIHCQRLRQARADERERIAQDEEVRLGNSYNAGWRAACERIAQAIEAVEPFLYGGRYLIYPGDAAQIARNGGRDE